jgi:lysylphosphatidylglycerol synthetase-like protein (DUF2156 family)
MATTLPSPRPKSPPLTISSPPLPDSRHAGDIASNDAAGILERQAQNPSAFLALNDGTRYFAVPGVDGVIAYQLAGRSTIVQLGGVFAEPADQGLLLGAFLDFAHVAKRKIVSVQLMRQDAELYATYGFTVNQFGADYSRALAAFNLKGKKYMQLRNKVSRARRAGVSVTEIDNAGRADLAGPLDEIDQVWLRSKGRHTKELKVMTGQRGGPAQSRRRLFVAHDASGVLLGYVSFSPVFGAESGWLHDLSRRRPDAPPGVLELIVVTAVERFQAEGAEHLHFGFTPFTNLSPEHEVAGASRVTARILRFLAVHGSAIYPAADQLAYKEKWGPDLVQPEYIAFQGRISLRRVWGLLRVTSAI